MAMDAILAIIADGEQAIVGIDREASRNKLFLHLIFTLILNPLTVALSNPFRRGSRGGVCSTIETMPLERQTAPSWWGCLCAVCLLAKSLPSGSFCSCQNGLSCKTVNFNMLHNYHDSRENLTF
jgi:hypothetical protein